MPVESLFIRSVRSRSLEHWMPLYKKGRWLDSPRDDELYGDLDKLQSIGYPSEVFVRGISSPPNDVLPDARKLKRGEVPSLTGSFPRPWQTLTPQERAYRSHIGNDVERIPLVPFERGYSLEAKDIFDWVKSRQLRIQAKNEAIRRENPRRSEESLYRDGKLYAGTVQPSLYWAGGKEVTVVHIDWGNFTDDEIATFFRKWLKQNRPSQYPVPSDKGKKLSDWRVALHRLGIMRALHVYTFADRRFPGVFRDRGEKHCYAARKAARLKFYSLFPFLSRDETPMNWETRGRASKQIPRHLD